MTLATNTPPGQNTSPVSWRAWLIQPALCRTETPARPRRLVSSLRQSRTCASHQSRWRASETVNPGCARRSGPRPPDASQIERHSRDMSQAVVYFPTPKYGCSSTRTGIAAEGERVTS